MKGPDKMATKINSNDLYNILASVHRFASNDVTRPNLRTLQVVFEDNKIKTITTNGHCLAKCEMNFMNSEYCTLNLDIEGVRDLLKILKKFRKDKNQVDVSIYNEGKTVIVSCEKFSINISVSNEPFPNYEHVIPKYTVNRSIASEVGCNPTYLKMISESVNEIDRGSFISIQFGNDALDPILIKSTIIHTDLTYVVMPIRL